MSSTAIKNGQNFVVWTNVEPRSNLILISSAHGSWKIGVLTGFNVLVSRPGHSAVRHRGAILAPEKNVLQGEEVLRGGWRESLVEQGSFLVQFTHRLFSWYKVRMPPNTHTHPSAPIVYHS